MHEKWCFSPEKHMKTPEKWKAHEKQLKSEKHMKTPEK